MGLTTDPVAQTRAEDFIRAALAYRTRQSERHASDRRTFTPIMVRIATIADDEPDDAMLPDTVEALTSERVRLDG